MLVDTHCHLNFPDYENDLDQVIKNAVENDVTKIICASSNIQDSKRAIELAQKYPGIVYALVGIHPQQTDPNNQNTVKVQVQELEGLVLSGSEWIAGIGECGLDYSPAPPPEKNRTKGEQSFVFEQQIKLALKYNLPISIHSRKATDETIKILSKYFPSNPSFPSCPSGVWHCYAGGKSKVQKITGLGLYFGVDGNLTYDEGLQNVIKAIPLEKIVLETDAPFLAPVPYRGLRNEPKNVKMIGDFLAKLKNVSSADLAQITTQNAKKIFKI
ncbi:hypothetical protein COT44_03160 [Candidatus Shapirobacteria bacterium CG08_land_8_20_14_0_20_39_18]|uniref:Hydrolase TatD n=1 Tax=Candidatus Shapirobacteria bacterium CG08_land_8_20_14_0_20_39_18 TaxID=1974883 RepID=A0A2M6XCR7_9BACT|nr:MAG: hypothetical protein COT44_03160 [Candidatus Shapirobacteria bacterium CG08_land_8_20_14_0_20_39_18]PIY66514.1 MAG: hypothetical protein COY91_00275 [Candidatus Shapirobacteria bacterium CG_4_10_14_0_8_um_filter_39_15]PJE68328.1 MAG: hypothetical protein COU94_02355 [Candidatus Shapirobacteria bacterium CG10_big_fil_rev_8_21_14_0_10_38_8]